MDLGLKGRVVLVTGASRGIGYDMALGFAREGAKVAICSRDIAKLEAVAGEIRALGAEALPLKADLLKPADCDRVIQETAARLGRLDVLVNNASASVDKTPATIVDSTDEQLMARITGKTMGAIRFSRAAVPVMRKAGNGGRIVIIGGTAGRSVFRAGEMPAMGSNLPQGLGNSALANFSKYLSEEVAGDRITVNIVHPHVTRTSRHADRMARLAKEKGRSEAEVEAEYEKNFPIGRMVEPADVTSIVLFLASAHAGAITGQSVTVDGGALRMVNF